MCIYILMHTVKGKQAVVAPAAADSTQLPLLVESLEYSPIYIYIYIYTHIYFYAYRKGKAGRRSARRRRSRVAPPSCRIPRIRCRCSRRGRARLKHRRLTNRRSLKKGKEKRFTSDLKMGRTGNRMGVCLFIGSPPGSSSAVGKEGLGALYL